MSGKLEEVRGVWISESILKLDISWTNKIILAEVLYLSSLDDGCLASNSYFADKLGMRKQHVSRALTQLSLDGYISIDNTATVRNFGRTILSNTEIKKVEVKKEIKNNDDEIFDAWFSNCWTAYKKYVNYYRSDDSKKSLAKKALSKTSKEIVKMKKKNIKEVLSVIEQFILEKRNEVHTQHLQNVVNTVDLIAWAEGE